MVAGEERSPPSEQDGDNAHSEHIDAVGGNERVHQQSAPEDEAVLALLTRWPHCADHVVAELDAWGGVAAASSVRGRDNYPFAERHVVPGLSLLVAAAPHDNEVDVFKEVIERQLVCRVEPGAGY